MTGTLEISKPNISAARQIADNAIRFLLTGEVCINNSLQNLGLKMPVQNRPDQKQSRSIRRENMPISILHLKHQLTRQRLNMAILEY
jgi:hypothetical protein